VAGSILVPLITGLASPYMQDRIFPWSAVPGSALIALGFAGVALWFNRRLQRWDGALDRAAAEHVDAIEIDPAILMLGRDGHPEHPYDNPRVRAVVNDARWFLRTTDHRYDLIVFGLLDSHTLLSQASSVRLDSFLYTVQAMREARARLKLGGMISLAFSVMNDPLGRKIYLMLQEAFDGRPPICIQVGYDTGVVFLESESGPFSLSPDFLTQRGFREKTAIYADPAVHADVSTDDWPFFYMPQRVYPVSYWPWSG
jgi:spermidine synthase